MSYNRSCKYMLISRKKKEIFKATRCGFMTRLLHASIVRNICTKYTNTFRIHGFFFQMYNVRTFWIRCLVIAILARRERTVLLINDRCLCMYTNRPRRCSFRMFLYSDIASAGALNGIVTRECTRLCVYTR